MSAEFRIKARSDTAAPERRVRVSDAVFYEAISKDKREKCAGSVRFAAISLRYVKFRIEGIKIPGIQMILYDPQRFTEALEVNYFTLAQKTDGVADLWILDQAQNVIVSGAGFLLCCNPIRTTLD